MGLTEEVEQLLREPVQGTTFGLTAWTEGVEGIERRANELDVADWNASMRQLFFAMLEGQRTAIVRLANEIEEQNASD